MFDDPKKELQRMEAQLRAAQEEDTDDSDWLEEAKSMMDREFEGDSADTVVFEEDEEEDEFSVPAPNKKKGIAGLIVLMCLELLGIGAVVVWWLQWLK